MTSAKAIIQLLMITSILLKVKCGAVEYVDLECEDTKFLSCDALSLEIDNDATFIRKVKYPNGSRVNTNGIVWLRIETGENSVKFIPAGIKKKIPNLLAIEIKNSGLIHLEREDLRQFGDDLDRTHFEYNRLTALESNIFEYNPNMKYVSFNGNPLKFINQILFVNLKKFKLIYMRFKNSTCIDRSDFSTDGWKNQKCNNVSAKNENFVRMSKRQGFFTQIYPEIRIDKVNSDLGMLQSEIVKLSNDSKLSLLKENLTIELTPQAYYIASIVCLGMMLGFIVSITYICIFRSKLAQYEKHILQQQHNMGVGVHNEGIDNNFYEEVELKRKSQGS